MSSALALELKSLTKTFGDFRALDSADLAVERGEVHALIGQNGAGKSTLIKIASGYYAPDSGEMAVGGQAISLPYPAWKAHRLGLGFFHQNLSMNPGLSVLENMRVGRYASTRYGRIQWRRERQRVAASLRSIGLATDPSTPVRKLRQSERALLAFVRAQQDLPETGGVLVLDEPTPYLARPSVEMLYDAIRAASSRGVATIFVSHRLDEVLAIADRISVIRDGKMVGTVTRAEASEELLVRMILGRDLGSLYPRRTDARPEIVMNVSGLSAQGVDRVDFSVHRGEILGLTGLIGMGHDDVPYAVFGATPSTGGTVQIQGTTIDAVSITPGSARKLGLGLLPADRPNMSGVPTATVLENLTMPVVGRYYRRGILNHRRERRDVVDLLDRYDVNPRDPAKALGLLSGGNQQKVLLAKWLQTKPSVLFLHEPTQGVDIGSRKQVFRAIHEIAQAGVAVAIASSEYEDLEHLCHRVLIFRDGRITRELEGENLTKERIVEQAFLAHRPSEESAALA
jgi:ribose transport system ATP-binding protein